MDRERTGEWLLPEDRFAAAEREIRQSLADLERGLEAARQAILAGERTSQALEEGLAEVGRIALRAAERSERALAAIEVRREAGRRVVAAGGEDPLRRFSERADRVVERLEELELSPGEPTVTAVSRPGHRR